MSLTQEEMLRLLTKLGKDVEIDEGDLQAYFPDISNTDAIRDFYIPKIQTGAMDAVYERLRRLTLPRRIR